MCAESKAQNTPLILYIILGYTDRQNSLPLPFSLSLSQPIYPLSFLISLNFAHYMHAHCKVNNILFHYIILHNDYHNKSWYNV